MTNETNNFKEYHDDIDAFAQDILGSLDTDDLHDFIENYASDSHDVFNEFDLQDSIWEYADSTQWVIYYHKAHWICQNLDISEAESEFEELGGSQEGDTYDSIACKIAFSKVRLDLTERVEELIQEELDK